MYHLRINNTSLFFHYWVSVAEWFENAGITDKVYLSTVTGKDFYLFQIVGIGEIWVTNKSLLERGDDYVSIQLSQIKFQDSK